MSLSQNAHRHVTVVAKRGSAGCSAKFDKESGNQKSTSDHGMLVQAAGGDDGFARKPG